VGNLPRIRLGRLLLAALLVGLALAGCAIPEDATTGGSSGGGTTATTKPGTYQDGMYEVGQEIKAGTYKTSGGSDRPCYYARLRSDETSDIIANNITEGPQTVRVRPGDAFVEFSGGCTWRRA